MPLVFLVVVLNPSATAGHSGGLNSSGCHAGSKPYHCHRSPSEMVGNRLRCDLGSKSVECDQSGSDEQPARTNSISGLRYREGAYSGEVINGLPHGQGTWSHAHFGKYVGKFVNGKMHGAGVHFFHEGGYLVGEWRVGNLHGQSVMSLPDGTKEIALYNNGEKYQTMLVLPDGSVFFGESRGDSIDGQGTFVETDGSLTIGEWKFDKAWNAIVYDASGTFAGSYKDGVPQQ